MSSRHLFLAVAVIAMLQIAVAAEAPWIPGKALITGITKGFTPSTFVAPQIVSNAFCGYGGLSQKEFPGFLLAGISPKSPLAKKPMKGCGTCLEVKCVDKNLCKIEKPITVMVYDVCYGCAADQINLYASAFSLMTPLNIGQTAVQYKEVACPFSGPITVNVATNIPGTYIQLSLRNVAGTSAISRVEMAPTGTKKWEKMNNSFGAVWELASAIAGPVDLRITKENGETVVLSNVISKKDQTGDIVATLNFRA